MNYKYLIIFLLLLISLASSVVLAFEPLSIICNAEQGCALVQNSIYAHTFGIKNSVYGVAIFSLLSIVTLLHILKPEKITKKIIKLSLISGSLVAVYFLFLQVFILHAFCKYCLVADFSVLIALLIFFLPDKKIVIT